MSDESSNLMLHFPYFSLCNFFISGGLDTTVSHVLAIPSKRNVRANSSDKAIKDYNELAKKKFESTQEIRGMATIVQNSMVTKNREQAQLAMTMSP